MYRYQNKIRSYIDMILATPTTTPSMQISCKIATLHRVYNSLAMLLLREKCKKSRLPKKREVSTTCIGSPGNMPISYRYYIDTHYIFPYCIGIVFF